MRLSVVLLVLSLAGVLGGAALIGLWALGVAVVADSVAVGAWALLREAGGRRVPSEAGPPTLAQVLERARRAA
jgi:hypothetical protein